MGHGPYQKVNWQLQSDSCLKAVVRDYRALLAMRYLGKKIYQESLMWIGGLDKDLEVHFLGFGGIEFFAL